MVEFGDLAVGLVGGDEEGDVLGDEGVYGGGDYALVYDNTSREVLARLIQLIIPQVLQPLNPILFLHPPPLI